MLIKNAEYQSFVPKLFDFLVEDQGTVVIKTFTFQVTDACSLCCSYCYQINKSCHSMTLDNAKQMIDYLFEKRKDPNFYFYEGTTKGLIIDFIGGEPLLEIELIHNICDYFEEKCLENPDCPWLLYHVYSFSTNGVAYFTDKVQKYLEEYGSISSMSVTIDGCKELHDKCRLFPNGEGSYDIAIQAALDQLQRGNDATKITISPDNVQYVSAGIQNMIELGFSCININCVFEEGWQISHAKILYNELKKTADWIVLNNFQNKVYVALFDTIKYTSHSDDISFSKNWCGVVGNMLALDYKGDIYPCIRFMESSLGNEVEPFSIGSLSDGIGNTLKDKERIDALNGLTKQAQSEDRCLTCPIESGCAWCSGYNYQKFGTMYKRATFICDMHKAGALGSLYFYKITQDKNSYDLIGITEEMSLDIIDKSEWDYLNTFEGGI